MTKIVQLELNDKDLEELQKSRVVQCFCSIENSTEEVLIRITKRKTYPKPLYEDSWAGRDKK